MDYTREPIIETIITPREGCKLVVRSSKAAGMEEYFVDALEVVSFGNSFFFRSKERPKAFLVPCTDYEVLEVREARMVLKNVAMERTIKIAGGKETGKGRQEDEVIEPVGRRKKRGSVKEKEEKKEGTNESEASPPKLEKKRERRKQYKKRRESRVVESVEGEESEEAGGEPSLPRLVLPPPEFGVRESAGGEKEKSPQTVTASTIALSAEKQPMVPPPPSLISETIARYKEDELFKQAFFEKGEDGDLIERDVEEHSRVQELLEEEEYEENTSTPPSEHSQESAAGDE